MKYIPEILYGRDSIITNKCYLFYIVLLIIPFASCSSSVKFSNPKADSAAESTEFDIYKDSEVLETIEGIASYYGEKFHLKRTSSGEIYNMRAMTASHKSYPFGTIVRVTNLINELNTIVKINDRLPKESKRIIDLSVKAAENLDFIKRGLTKVKLEVLRWGE